MKKKMIFKAAMLVMLVILALVLEAAEFGVKAGYEGNEGYKVGVSVGFQLVKGLYFQPELLFSQRKYAYQAKDISWWEGYYYENEVTMHDKIDFIEVPLLFKYKVDIRGRIKPFVLAGGYMAFNLNKERDLYSITNEVLMDETFVPWGILFPNRYYEQSEAGLVFGTGLEYGCGKMKMTLEVRANLGLTGFQQVTELYYYGLEYYHIASWANDKIKSRSISVLVGFSF